ncbi:DUF916 and DUF3324 domain-containing protein [Enterococcus faecalis]
MRKLVKLSFLIFFVAGLFYGKNFVYASNKNIFTISPLNPDTGEVMSNYFDLMVKPNEEKTLTIRVFNDSDKESNIVVSANNGSTNDNGITSYLGTEERDETLKVAFTDLVNKKDQKITLAAHSHKDVSLHIKVPKESFEGEILGGIRVTSNNELNKETDEQNTSVSNNIAYTIGVVLRESTREILPEINLLGVKVEQRNSRNYISSNLQNRAPKIIKDLKVEQKIYVKGTDDTVYASSNSNMRMAPNSNFHYGVNLEDEPLKAGEYTIKISGTADGTPFSFVKDFTIEAKEANEFNKNSIFVKDSNTTPSWTYLVIGVLLIIIIMGVYIILKGAKRSEE